MIGGQVMARGRKKQVNLTLEEQLEAVDNKILECKEQLKNLKEKRKELYEQMVGTQKEKLYRAVVESGRSVEEVIEMIYEQAKAM